MHLLHPRLFPKVAFVVYLNFNGVGLTVAIDLGALDEQKGFVLEDDATALVVVLVVGKLGRSRTAGPHHLLEAGVLELAGGCVGLCVERHLPWLIGDPVTQEGLRHDGLAALLRRHHASDHPDRPILQVPQRLFGPRDVVRVVIPLERLGIAEVHVFRCPFIDFPVIPHPGADAGNLNYLGRCYHRAWSSLSPDRRSALSWLRSGPLR